MQANRRVIGTLWFWLCCGLIMLIGGAPGYGQGAAGPTVAQAGVATAPPLPGQARVWVLRQWDPINMIGEPMVYANGRPLGSSRAGTAYYRDLPAGTYTFSVESCGSDVNQAQTLNLAPGNQVDLEIQSLTGFSNWGCVETNTFYVRVISPAIAQRYFQQLSYLGPR